MLVLFVFVHGGTLKTKVWCRHVFVFLILGLLYYRSKYLYVGFSNGDVTLSHLMILSIIGVVIVTERTHHRKPEQLNDERNTTTLGAHSLVQWPHRPSNLQNHVNSQKMKP